MLGATTIVPWLWNGASEIRVKHMGIYFSQFGGRGKSRARSCICQSQWGSMGRCLLSIRRV